VAERRQQLASRWLHQILGDGVQMSALAGDASSRRYFRVTQHDQHWILMDAPPPLCTVEPFVRIANWLARGGIRVPALVAQDIPSGLLLLEDLGDVTWAQALTKGVDVEPLMADAMEQLLRLQALNGDSVRLSRFDSVRIEHECALYADWYLPHVRGQKMSDHDRVQFLYELEIVFNHFASQPQVAVHLDFHSRNLMLLGEEATPLGVIDFQDACIGPVAYDIASLIYDCYQDYGELQAHAWSRSFYEMLPKKQQRCYSSWEAWHQSLLITSLQRHIKVCGIFVRLALRDGKTQFLASLPQTRSHLCYEVDALAAMVSRLHPWLLDKL